ncbi:QVPTGV class sortase B protein-sorting domain-containing protein [Thermoproteota archaeon]
MSRIKSLLMSTLSTAIGALGLAQPVLGEQQNGIPVGGVAAAANKLAIVAPYLVLAGLVAVASVIYIKKRKH